MNKRRKLKLDRVTIRKLTETETEKAAGGHITASLFRCPSDRCTLDYGPTCYSCDATWCNVFCSMRACE